MKRRCAVPKEQIEANTHILKRVDRSKMSNFEERMLAEVELYWIIYEQSSAIHRRHHIESALESWKRNWQPLFGECFLLYFSIPAIVPPCVFQHGHAPASHVICGPAYSESYLTNQYRPTALSVSPDGLSFRVPAHFTRQHIAQLCVSGAIGVKRYPRQASAPYNFYSEPRYSHIGRSYATSH